jgi:hypothetical protein
VNPLFHALGSAGISLPQNAEDSKVVNAFGVLLHASEKKSGVGGKQY